MWPEQQTGVPLPNITHVMYGRDVGYAVERVELPARVEAISATEIRRQIGEAAAAFAQPMLSRA